MSTILSLETVKLMEEKPDSPESICCSPGRGSCIPAGGFPLLFSFVLHPISLFSALLSALSLTVDSEAAPLPGPELKNSKVIIFWQDDGFGL